MHNELPSHFHAIEILEQWLWKQPNREAVVDIPVYPWKIAVAVDGYCKVRYTRGGPISHAVAMQVISLLPKEEVDLILLAMELQ